MRNRRATKQTRYRVFDGKHSVELKLHTPNQLFDERDPAPFRDRDLDDDAARYILGSFRDLKGQGEVRLSLYFETLGNFKGRPRDISDAIHTFFKYESEAKRRELRETFRQGVISLFIGLGFLFLCSNLAEHARGILHWLGDTTLLPMLKEGLGIMGYVAMWRPLTIFLYDWWPIRDEMKDYMNLGDIEVDIRARELPEFRSTEETSESRPTLWKREPSTVS